MGDVHCRFSNPEKPSRELEKRLSSQNEQTAKRLTVLGSVRGRGHYKRERLMTVTLTYLPTQTEGLLDVTTTWLAFVVLIEHWVYLARDIFL